MLATGTRSTYRSVITWVGRADISGPKCLGKRTRCTDGIGKGDEAGWSSL